MAIYPIPTTRVSNLYSTNRLTQQIQADQLALLRAQTQISTGRRIMSPSEDAPASLRAMTLQRLLERQDQTQTSLNDSILFLGEAENSINEVSSILNSIKAEALGVDSTLSSDQEIQAVMDQIDRALEQLVDMGNSQFRERYLFAGSRSQALPYDYQDGYVQYQGNEASLRSYVAAGTLYETNIPGTDVFGGISEQMLGNIDLDPHVSADTKVEDLNGGYGVSSGAVEIIHIDSTGKSTSTVVDLSNAATLGDIARYLEAGAPSNSDIQVEITGTGLQLTAPSGEFVMVSEVGEGRTARDVGIFTTSAQNTLVGSDITPRVTKTTPLSELLGTKASATVTSGGYDNDIIVRATQNGTNVDPSDALSDPLNGVTIQFVDGGTAGNETAVYDGSTATLTVSIDAGVSTASQVVAAINAESSGLFTAEIDYSDAEDHTTAGSGVVALTSTAVTSGGSGEVLDTTSGLLVTNGENSVEVDISSATTVEELLNILNQQELGLQVEINSSGTGINIRSRLSGADLSIGEVSGGTTATQLGVRTLSETSSLAEFNRGIGVLPDDVTTFQIELTTLGVPTSYPIDLDGATTVQDVIDIVNTQTGGAVTVQLVSHGNGIELVDNTGADSMTISGQPAELLGFFEDGDGSATSTTGTLATGDNHTLETESVFNTLIRLRDALEAKDFTAIGNEINQIDVDLDRINFARSDLGSRLQSLESLQNRQEDENIALQSALSDEIDVDLAEAISEFTSRQYALQASLQVSSSIMRMTLLDFL
ncbi:flagellin N-terminal helical domain-containing protein [Aeoliella mucimassa]|uniref:Flagellin n=1 Tax=Aeoliella mucimassa TaxID=2527972 RepID=A0A518ARU6_9BACT|nr:flagellin [Aeoliella mucimassa]QDU57440.1 flagellar hook-associated protein FlgL [Aeoliella mucimassa]